LCNKTTGVFKEKPEMLETLKCFMPHYAATLICLEENAGSRKTWNKNNLILMSF